MLNNNLRFSKFQTGLIILALLFFYFWYQAVSNQFTGEASKEFQLSRGDNFITIGANLKSAGIIKSKLVFWFITLARGSVNNLQAGQYVFEPKLNLIEIIKKIENGRALKENEITVVIPEGFNLAEIQQRFQEAGFNQEIALTKLKATPLSDSFGWLNLVSTQFNTLEGFLFPDSYRFQKDASSQEILNKILKNFETKTEELRAPKILKGRNFYDILIMASILEKEVPPQDMPLAAGVLWKRLELDMPLQVDATLVYILGRAIKSSDTTMLDSPFNSYKFKGLPPTPISNPGLIAMKAALNPQVSDYLFYLSSAKEGKTIFSTTLEEHNLAKIKHL